MGVDGQPLDHQRIRARLSQLREEHRELDAAVHAMGALGVDDQLKIARLKKKKLALKDEIAWLEDQLSPDIIA